MPGSRINTGIAKKQQKISKKMKKVLAFYFLLLYNTSCRYDIRQTTLGFRQMVRHWILIPALWGFESLKPSPLSLA